MREKERKEEGEWNPLGGKFDIISFVGSNSRSFEDIGAQDPEKSFPSHQTWSSQDHIDIMGRLTE